ncbi:DEAD/DEAH box helicase [Streptomyces sp. NBC_00264]|uniref:DEAD/DEAH box helicase n=1 Tax=unclassified Streptomyces TaxID=2593676 RepID=UPI001F1516C3|nr:MULTISPECIES: DEAD/DEAH box helicase [unclassified Streptomyces]WSG55862.1 DEAD/DEAH box helicase [Streptomyces sp. NBC_01732]WSX06997.1 DEAD/DEAH box helicase [Streptomyces sp. NBC_00987]MCX5161552.1 DEAD/DEAH box helicase [Streptomyces sp. NBC_00305]MCX5220075.1 DEAD/DEAH box helicase [Streptomyces sp. NBC_00264]WSC33306.1 DEAD/DEAH box helicase [Streptomyces sp. NBC_01768]
MLDNGWAAVFLPGEPARLGRLLLWQPAGAAAAEGTAPIGVETDAVELVLPHGRSVRRRKVTGHALPAALAVAALTGAQPPNPSAAAWQAAARFALRLLADGRLHPALTPAGYDTWQAGPFTAAQRQNLDALAAAFPPHAHCLPEPGPPPVRIAEPTALVRQFCDAVADDLVRTPAAPLAMGALPYAWRETRAVPALREWAEETATAFTADVGVSLRVDPPEGRRRVFRAVPQLHTAADPGLVVEAARLWSEPDEVERLLGPRAETETLLALRRGARAWPPLQRLLRDTAPDELRLSDDEALDLLGDATDTLRSAGIDVHWPRELVKALTAAAEIGQRTAPGSSAGGLLGADALLDFRWQISLGGEPLTEAEMDALAETRRPLVRLRDQWVVADPKLVARVRRRRMEPLTPMEALSATLTGEVERDGEQIPCEAVGALGDLVARIRDPESRTPAPQPAALKAMLRDYQRRGLAWLAEMCELGLGGCLADDMGLGKTITLLALHLHRQTDPATAGPTLVVCPASLLGNWEREAARFAPSTPVRRYHGGERHLDDLADDEIVLVTYGVLRHDREALAGSDWSLIAADEAQHVKNPYAVTARELRAVPARARVALTGTPVENNLSELWALLDWTTPGLLGPLAAFRDRHARAIESGEDPEAAGRLSRLVRPFLLRRRKSDPGIAPELPAKTETERVVALTAEQAGLYEAVVRETMAKIEESEGIARRGLVLKLLTGLKQICNHPAQYLRQSTPLGGRSGKLDLLDELLGTITAEGESVLVFTQYKQMATLLEKHLAERGTPTLFLHGGTPVARREEMVERFQRGEVPVFLLSLKAAGTGLNLTRATHVVHYDRWWNPAVEDQATDRAYRIGQDRPVQVHKLIAEGTVEDKVAQLLESKRTLADAVVGSGEAALTELSDADLAELVALGRQS